MNDLIEAMRAATDSPPPARVDIDGLLRADHRRTRIIRGLAALTVAALVGGVLAGSALTTGHRAGPATDPVAGSLDATWRAALDRALPAGYGVLVDTGFGWDADTSTYRDITTVTAPDGTVTTFVVRLGHTTAPDVTKCGLLLPPLTCVPPNDQDGLYYQSSAKWYGTTWTTDVLRPIGGGRAAEVYVSETAPSLARAALGLAALAALARESGLRW